MRRVKSLEFIFENCLSVVVPFDSIGRFTLKNIYSTVERIAINSIEEITHADEFAIEIFKKGNKDFHPFDIEDETQSLFDTITDIPLAEVKLIFEDKTEQIYVLPFDDSKRECENIYQKVYISKQGNLYLVVDKTKNINDYFDKKAIDNAVEMSFLEDILSISVDIEPIREIESEGLPPMYKYVFLYDRTDQNDVLAVRVFDSETGWKWLISGGGEIHEPTHYKFLNDALIKSVNRTRNFSMAKIIRDTFPSEFDSDSSIYNYYEEANREVEKFIKDIANIIK